ncbi:MAG: hypothetical protein V3V72_09160 [Ignavibacteriaceae bacterium]
MKKLLLFTLLFGLSTVVYSQNINGRFSSSLYTFERFDSAGSSNTYARTFQMLSLNFGKQNVWLRTNLNLEGEIAERLVDNPRLRFYNLYLDVRNIWDLISFKLGRQPLFNSIAGGVFDGATLGLNYEDYKFKVYYGGNVPAYQELKLTDSWKDDYVLGGEFTIYALQDLRIALKYINKNFRNISYRANRLDANLNPIKKEIENNSRQYQFVTAEVSYAKQDKYRIDTRYDYDINFEKTSKLELSGRYEEVNNLGITLYYNYREPRIRYNSIFSVFDYGNTWEIEGGVDYRIENTYTVIGKFANVSYKEETSQRLTLGLSSQYGTLTGRKSFGYAGEMDAISLYTAFTTLEGLVTPSFGFSFTRYKQSVSSPRNELTTFMAGFNLRPWRTVSLDFQGQYMNNKIYKNDWRLFLKLNFWFNSNLDI